jgi:DNA-binding CsgD family transcriptional regulator
MAFNLDPLQKGIADMVAAGMANAEIASQLSYSERSAKRDLTEIFTIMGVQSRDEAALAWRNSGQWCGITKQGT